MMRSYENSWFLLIVFALSGTIAILFDFSELSLQVAAIVSGLACFLVALKRFEIGMYIFAFVVPFEDVLALSRVFNAAKIVMLIVLLSLLTKVVSSQDSLYGIRCTLKKPLSKCFLAFTLLALLSSLWAYDQGAALVKASTLTGLFLMMLCISQLDEQQTLKFWLCFAMSALASIPFGMLISAPGERMASGKGNPNDFALYLAVAFLFLFFTKPKFRLLWGVFLIGILYSQSRTALVVLMITPLFAICVPGLNKKALSRTFIYATIAVLFVGGALMFIQDTAILERFLSVREADREDTWTGRLELWRAAFFISIENPLTGVGTGNFGHSCVRYSELCAAYLHWEGVLASVHNVYLAASAELGIIGLVLFMGITFHAFRMLNLLMKEPSELYTALGFALIACTVSGFAVPWEMVKVPYMVYGSLLALHFGQQNLGDSRLASGDLQSNQLKYQQVGGR